MSSNYSHFLASARLYFAFRRGCCPALGREVAGSALSSLAAILTHFGAALRSPV